MPQRTLRRTSACRRPPTAYARASLPLSAAPELERSGNSPGSVDAPCAARFRSSPVPDACGCRFRAPAMSLNGELPPVPMVGCWLFASIWGDRCRRLPLGVKPTYQGPPNRGGASLRAAPFQTDCAFSVSHTTPPAFPAPPPESFAPVLPARAFRPSPGAAPIRGSSAEDRRRATRSCRPGCRGHRGLKWASCATALLGAAQHSGSWALAASHQKQKLARNRLNFR
jgi:hypothetical protein